MQDIEAGHGHEQLAGEMLGSTYAGGASLYRLSRDPLRRTRDDLSRIARIAACRQSDRGSPIARSAAMSRSDLESNRREDRSGSWLCENSYIAEMWKIQFSNTGSSLMCAALALMMRHFFEMFLRARRALEFSNGQGRKQSIATSIAGNPMRRAAKSRRRPVPPPASSC